MTFKIFHFFWMKLFTEFNLNSHTILVLRKMHFSVILLFTKKKVFSSSNFMHSHHPHVLGVSHPDTLSDRLVWMIFEGGQGFQFSFFSLCNRDLDKGAASSSGQAPLHIERIQHRTGHLPEVFSPTVRVQSSAMLGSQDRKPSLALPAISINCTS